MKLFDTACLGLLLSLSGIASAGDVTVTVEQITSGPKNHFFGYIGHCLTIPWNPAKWPELLTKWLDALRRRTPRRRFLL